MTLKEARFLTGGLSQPGKMPGAGYGLPAFFCPSGKIFRAFSNSVCSKCYARKGRYLFRNVQSAQQKRLLAIEDPLWTDAMCVLLENERANNRMWFRWHDSGDLMHYAHLSHIVSLAGRLPDMHFWLPTKAYRLIWQLVNDQNIYIPDNLTVRISHPYMNTYKPLARKWAKKGIVQSVVYHKKESFPAGTFNCPAISDPSYNSKCGSCRACWCKSTGIVNYQLH